MALLIRTMNLSGLDELSRSSPPTMAPHMFAAGSKVGPYEVLGLLGEGGMGQVYRGRDPRLGRDIAIKVLAKDALQDAEATGRLEREARAIAALSHPNIVAVHDVGREEGSFYLVTEL